MTTAEELPTYVVRMVSLTREGKADAAAALAEELGFDLAVAGLCGLVLGLLGALDDNTGGQVTDEVLLGLLDPEGGR